MNTPTEFSLTKREKDVLNLISKGLSNKEISKILLVSNNTVKTHLLKIYKKLNVKNRTQAVIKTKTNVNGVNIYPNPANESLTISFGKEFNGGIEIQNLNGKIVLKETINSSSIKLNLSAIAKGIYILKITDININQQYRLVVN